MDYADPNLPKKVAVDRYRKRIREEDANRAEANYAKSAIVGALAGLAARFRNAAPAHRAAIGAGAGLLAEGITRAAGSGTKDFYGERSRNAKRSEKLPILGGLAAAGVLAHRRKLFSRTTGTKVLNGSRPIHFGLSATLRRKLIYGGALAGGITAADVATSARYPREGQSRGEAAKEGLTRGAIYGGTLAGAEPVLRSLATRLLNARRKIDMAKFQKLFERPANHANLRESRVVEFRSLDRQPITIKTREDEDARDVRAQRIKLALYGGGALLGAGGLAILARRPGGTAAETAAATLKPVGRGTLERTIKAKSLVAERGYIHMRPMLPGESKRFDKLPAATKAKVGKFSGLARNPALSAGEKQKFRQAIGKLRSIHRFESGSQESRKGQLVLPIEFSSFIKDIAMKDLPAAARKDIRAFHPAITDDTLVAHYGMVAKELAGKADIHNLAAARKNVGQISKKAAADEVYAKRGKKFILLNNDQIVDGHHFLAKAERGRVSASLHVIDLTPSRFQTRTKSTKGTRAAKNLQAKLRRAVNLSCRSGRGVRYFMDGPMPQTDLPPWVMQRRKNQKRREHIRTAEQVAGIGGGAAAVASLAERFLAHRKKLGARLGTAVKLSRRFKGSTEFKREQLREKGSDRFADPYKVSIGETRAYYHAPGGQKIDVGDYPVHHAQVLKKLYRDAGTVSKIGSRVGAILRDTGDVVSGSPRRTDLYGRPQRREWEKPYFHRAVRDTAIAAVGLGGLLALRKSPALRAHVMSGAHEIRRKVNKVIPDFFAGRKLPANVVSLASRFGIKPITSMSTSRSRSIEFDDVANWAGWDVRDPRGRSARVFAPGSRARMRRDKQWHERIDNQRKILGAIAALGTVAGVGGGILIGRKIPRKIGAAIPHPRKIIEGPWSHLPA